MSSKTSTNIDHKTKHNTVTHPCKLLQILD